MTMETNTNAVDTANRELTSFRSLGRAFAYIDAMATARDTANAAADEGIELAGFVSLAKGGF
jgi:hypothetical protein